MRLKQRNSQFPGDSMTYQRHGESESTNGTLVLGG